MKRAALSYAASLRDLIAAAGTREAELRSNALSVFDQMATANAELL